MPDQAPDFTSPIAGRIEVRQPCPWCGDRQMIPRHQFDEHVMRLHPDVRTVERRAAVSLPPATDQTEPARPTWRCPTCGPVTTEAHPRLPVRRCSNCKEHVLTDETSPAGDRLFALIASIPGSGAVDWCEPARALIAELEQAAAAPGAWVDGHPQLEAVAAAVWDQCGRSDSGMCVEDDPRNIAVAALSAVAVLPADQRAATLREGAAALEALDPVEAALAGQHAWADTAALLRRVAGEEPHTTETPDAKSTVCQGFQWIGQSFATCDRCGQPAWEHEGEEVSAEDAGPFDSRRTVRPWAPGQAEAIRAKWQPPAASAVPAAPDTEA